MLFQNKTTFSHFIIQKRQSTAIPLSKKNTAFLLSNTTEQLCLLTSDKKHEVIVYVYLKQNKTMVVHHRILSIGSLSQSAVAALSQHSLAAPRARKLKQDQSIDNYPQIIINIKLHNSDLYTQRFSIKDYKVQCSTMPPHAMLGEIVGYLTNSAQISPRNLLLKMRFRYPQQLPTFLDFLVFVLITPNINSQQPIQVSRMLQLIKELILEADLYTTLLVLSKICPLIKGKHNVNSKKAALQAKFKQWIGTSKSQINFGNVSAQIGKEIMEWMGRNNYLTFYIQHMNYHTLKKYEDIQIYFTQLRKQTNTPFNQTQLAFLKTQMLTQYEKINTAKYKQQSVTCLYEWFKEELKLALAEPFDNACSLLAIDTLSRVVRSDCDLACSALVQACEYILPITRPGSFENFILLVDQILLASNAVTMIQTVLVIVPALFIKALQPKTTLNSDLIVLHLDFWRHIVSKRFIDSTLLMCLNDWIKRILHLNNNSTKTEELLQLFKVQLQRKVKNKNLQDLKCIFAQKEIQKIQQVYQQIHMFHQILQKSNISYFIEQKKHNTNKDLFNYEVSLLSSKGELLSMLDSIHKHQAELKVDNLEQNQQQLKIYSNKNSVARYDSEEDITAQRVNYVLTLLDLLELKQQKKKESSSVVSWIKQPLLPFLPLFSSNQNLENNSKDSTQISDPYGLNLKCRQQTQQINPIFIPISQLNKKKVIKNKGIIIKTKSIEIGYIFESVYGRRRLSLFVTFEQLVTNVSISIDENSIKFTKEFSIEFLNPKIKKQFRTELDIQKVGLYKIEGQLQCLRFIKPKMLIKMRQKMEEQREMKQQIPLYLYNLIEWLEIPQKQQEIFNLKAQIASPWLKVCTLLKKIKQPETSNIFPYCKIDKKGTIMIKMRFLLQAIFCKIYIVLDQVKVELINSDSQTVLLALLEIICQQDRNNQ